MISPKSSYQMQNMQSMSYMPQMSSQLGAVGQLSNGYTNQLNGHLNGASQLNQSNNALNSINAHDLGIFFMSLYSIYLLVIHTTSGNHA